MQAFKVQLILTLLVVLCMLSPQPLRAELVATSGDAKLITLSPLQNGLSALTLVWPIDRSTKERVSALKAGLSSVVSGGTSSRSSYEIREFLKLNGIEQQVGTNGQNLLLTISAPDEVFPETLVHLENLLLKPEYTSGWYARALQKLSLNTSTRTRMPSDVLNEIADFLEYEPGDAAAEESGGEFRFGHPSQAILRSEDQEVERRTVRLVQKLPKATATWGLPFAKWVDALLGAEEKPFELPTGTVHFADPDSTEMLILFAKAEEFADDNDQIGSNLLIDYIGAGQGSKMFQTIRQEMRAAYDPRSDFRVMKKNQALLSFSATVEANKWPEVHDKVREIYNAVRNGKIEQAGLGIQYDRLAQHYYESVFLYPGWGEHHYLDEYPTGAEGPITISLFGALETASIAEITDNSEAHLPPLEDFLLVLIGGGAAPTKAIKSNGYCALPKNTHLSFCLEALSNVQN